MKKFLSSLLALTMILSLVIVPANAADQALADGYTLNGSFSVTADKESVASGETVNLTAANITATKTSAESQPTFTYTYTWGSGATPTTPGAKTATATPTTSSTVGDSKTYSCTLVIMDTTNSVKVLESTQSVTVSIKSAQAAFEDALRAAKVTFNGRKYDIINWATTVKYFEGEASNLADETKYSCTLTGSSVSLSEDGKKLTVYNSDKSCSKDITLKTEKAVTTKPTISVNYGKDLNETREGQKTELSVSYKAETSSPVTYKWYFNSKPKANSNKNTYDCSEISAGNYTVTVEIYEGDTLAVTSNELTLKVKEDPYKNTVTAKSGYKTSMIANQTQALEITIAGQASGTDYSVKWNSSKTDIATINESGKVGTLTAKNKTGSTKVTAVVTYLNKDYTVDFGTISVEAADAKFGSVKNGDSDYYTDSQLTSLVVDAINKISTSSYTASDVTSIKIKELPDHVTLYADKIESSASLKKNADLTTPDRIYYEADKGYIDTDGDKTQLIVDVQLKNAGTPTVTISIPVVGDETIKETVTGNAANKDVTFTNSDYKYLYYTTSKVSDYNGYYTGSKVGVFGLPVAEDKTVTIPASAFKDKTTVTLYVVGLDKYGVASTGTIEVSQKAYDIKYSVVAGESVSFDQKRFESFMEDYADDNIKTSKGDYFEFDYVKFDSLPNSTREGVLYEGKDKIKTSTEVENLDKVTFESVTKAKDTIKVPFTLYAKQYDKNDKVIDKKVSMTGEVVISVVKEDIVYEVGVNSAVKLGSDKFIDFLRDSDKSYKKADLDYVTFDVGKNSAITSYFNGTGALYRYYNGSTGVNSTVSAKDEFYYNPKTSSKHYDLDDVAYVTSKFAKVGDIVYIPFTAYGTKSGQKAEGTLAIKVKQTMNFVDVHTYDYFYDSVQWAVNLDITKGTSTTTFSPKQGCTRAQIVTFLWRAANSPAPRSSTSKFADVYATAHADYMKAINWATEQGITTGTGNGKFSPDATCTRAQIVTFLYRFKGNPAVYGSLNFSDVNKTEHAAFYNAILWAVNNKITTGYGNGIFDPNGTCNRGDAVTFLYRALA